MSRRPVQSRKRTHDELEQPVTITHSCAALPVVGPGSRRRIRLMSVSSWRSCCASTRVFFSSKGVVAEVTDDCAVYPAADQSVS